MTGGGISGVIVVTHEANSLQSRSPSREALFVFTSDPRKGLRQMNLLEKYIRVTVKKSVSARKVTYVVSLKQNLTQMSTVVLLRPSNLCSQRIRWSARLVTCKCLIC